MMMRSEHFGKLFPKTFEPAASIGYAGEPSSECLARWEDDGGRAAPPHLDHYAEGVMRESSTGIRLRVVKPAA